VRKKTAARGIVRFSARVAYGEARQVVAGLIEDRLAQGGFDVHGRHLHAAYSVMPW
jgi:hypothetical protein